MFGSLIDNLDASCWKEISMAEKNEDEWTEYRVLIHHKHITDTTLQFFIAVEDEEGKSVELKNCLPNKDPLKQIGNIEVRLNSEGTEITGLDLNGDIVVRI